MVSAKHTVVLVILVRELSVIWLRDHLPFTHKHMFVGLVEQGKDFIMLILSLDLNIVSNVMIITTLVPFLSNLESFIRLSALHVKFREYRTTCYRFGLLGMWEAVVDSSLGSI